MVQSHRVRVGLQQAIDFMTNNPPSPAQPAAVAVAHPVPPASSGVQPAAAVPPMLLSRGDSTSDAILIESQDPNESPDHQLEEHDGATTSCGGGGTAGVDVAPQHQDAGSSSGVGAAARSGERKQPTSAAGEAKQVPEEEETESDGDGDGGSDCGEGSGSRKRKGVSHCQSCESVDARRL